MFVCMHYCTHSVMRFFKNILYEHSIKVDKLFKALKVNYFAKLACSICNHIFLLILLILYMHHSKTQPRLRCYTKFRIS